MTVLNIEGNCTVVIVCSFFLKHWYFYLFKEALLSKQGEDKRVLYVSPVKFTASE